MTTRRDFLRLLGAAGALAGLGGRAAAGPAPMRAGLIVPAGAAESRSVLAGARLGAGEASRVAELMRTTFDLEVAEVGSAGEAAAAGRRMAAAGAVAVIGGVDAACCRALAAALPESFLEVRARRQRAPEAAGAAHLRVTPGYGESASALAAGLRRRGVERFAMLDDDPVLRREARRAGLAEVAAGEAQVLLARTARPVGKRLLAGVTLAAGAGVAVPVAWHPSLVRFGAGELNERFVEATGRGMDEDAWAGWMAVKIAVEAALRGRALSAGRYDGHKGVALEFVDGRLRQPLYVQIGAGAGAEVIDV